MREDMMIAVKYKLIICCVFVFSAVVWAGRSHITVNAASTGIYTATAVPYYAHPVTGEIEDSGGSSQTALGQSMVESVVCQTALIEVDSAGNTYATVRFFLADQISDVSFLVQESGDSGWMSTDVAITQQNAGGEYCTDYRLLLTSETSVGRSTFYVESMGRYVVCYFNFNSLVEGNSTDFISTIDTTIAETDNTTTDSTAAGSTTAAATGSITAAAETEKQTEAETEAKTETQETEKETETETQAETKATAVLSDDPLENAQGLITSGENTTETESETDTSATAEASQISTVSMLPLMLMMVGCGVITGVILMAIGGGVIYLIWKKKRTEELL